MPRPTLEEPTSAIAIRGRRSYTLALKELAHRRETTVADLVRQAVDSAHGDELSELARFFDQLDYHGHRPRTKANARDRA